jgi:hypothetical protein
VLGGSAAIPVTRGRCANRSCGQGKDERGNRVRAKVLKVGDFCSSACSSRIKEAAKQKKRSAGAVSVL